MGNKASAGKTEGVGGGGTALHASLMSTKSFRQSMGRSFSPSTKSLRSARSVRKMSIMFSTRDKEPPVSSREPSEKLPPDIESFLEMDAVELKMHRNLCGCTDPLVRVDIVTIVEGESAAHTTSRQRSLVDRRVTVQTHNDVLRVMRRGPVIHSYLAHQWIDSSSSTEERIQQQQHPHLVTLHGHFLELQSFHVLTEYYPQGSLQTLLDPDSDTTAKGNPFQHERSIREAIRQLCSAVAFLHEQGVAHMDICLDNIFVDGLGAVHLGDFHDAIFIGKTHRRRRMAPPPVRRVYAAPELYSGREVDLLKADAWSVGIVIVMLLTKQTPMNEATTRDLHYRRLQVLGVRVFLENMIKDARDADDQQRPVDVSPIVEEIVELLVALLVCEPDKRCAVQDAMTQFPWLAMELRPPATHIASVTEPVLDSDDVSSNAFTLAETEPMS